MPQNVKEILERLQREPIIRTFTLDRAALNEEARTIPIAFASDKPINHWFGQLVLSMDKKAMRSERLKAGAPLLMDHRSWDWTAQVGVIEQHSIDKDRVARADVRFSKSARGEEVLQDVKDGIRQSISVGFMIHEIHLEKSEKGKPDLYRSDDWEPYEISIVNVPADISVGVGRNKQADFNPLEFSQAHERAIQTQQESTMPEEKNETPGTPAVVETRSAEQIVIDEIQAWGRNFKQEEFATTFIRDCKLGDSPATPTVDAFFAALRAHERATNPNVRVPAMDPHTAAARQGGGIEFSPTNEMVEVDRRTRQIVEQQTYGLTDRQMNAVFSREYREAFTMYVRRKGQRDLTPSHLRALSEGVDSEGGFLVPAEFLAKMVEREPAPTELQSLVTNLQAGTDKLTMPRNAYSASDLYTTGIRVQWVDEKTGPTSEADATDFGNLTIPIHTAMMYHDVTNNMLEDSAFDILGWLANKFRETADVVTENVIINGTGIGQPNGILLNPGGANEPAIQVSGDANLLTADGLMDLTYAVLGRYTDNARFVFNRLSTEKAIAKLKDTTNRYLFAYGEMDRNGLVSARPASLLGFPIISSDFMPNIAANAFPIIFGDPRGYYLVRRVGFSIQVLQEIVATANKVRVLGRMRLGGQVAEDWRLKIQKVSA